CRAGERGRVAASASLRARPGRIGFAPTQPIAGLRSKDRPKLLDCGFGDVARCGQRPSYACQKENAA
ncbi:hypothetical protein, partial [Burkholderia gladioli]|uniref:hypothetical protein n=1 Tax=Burkholderia gladioli TaxID=28095 RepID=UPI001C614052